VFDFEEKRLFRPPAPLWAEHQEKGDMAVGVIGDKKWGWSVALLKYGKTMWLFQSRLAGPFDREIDAIMECRHVANLRRLPRAF